MDDYEKEAQLRLEVLEIQAATLRHFEAGRVQRERNEEHERALRTGYFERQAELNSPEAKRQQLRDQCAMSAMNALIYRLGGIFSEDSAASAWRMADAMLEAKPK